MRDLGLLLQRLCGRGPAASWPPVLSVNWWRQRLRLLSPLVVLNRVATAASVQKPKGEGL